MTFPDLQVGLAGNAVIARHIHTLGIRTDGKPSSVRIGALVVWQQQVGSRKLLAPQGYKLA